MSNCVNVKRNGRKLLTERIVQEFINNALKHGKAKNIRIEGSFNKRARKLEFKMSDDGHGFDTDKIKSGGMG